MGANEAIRLQGVDTFQLWAQGCGQEALRVQLGPRHPYLSLSLAGLCHSVCRRLEPVAVPRPSGKWTLPPSCCKSTGTAGRAPLGVFLPPLKGLGSAAVEVTQALLGATDSQLFSDVQRIIPSFLLPATQYPIITMARDAVCTHRLKTLSWWPRGQSLHSAGKPSHLSL